MKQDLWNYVAKKKLINNSKCVLYFRFLQAAALCFVDSAANTRPSLNELHDVVTWDGFTPQVCLSAIICGICCLLHGVGTIRCVVHSWQPYLTTVRIHIMTRPNQLSKEKQQPIITLRTEGQSVQETLKLWMCPPKPSRLRSNCLTWGRPRKGRPRVTSAAEDTFIRVTSLRNH